MLGEYLRARRELVTPADVGLPPSARRRVRGLRREEVAMLAGISSDYYLRLEQGRDRNPSPQILNALARVLDLDQAATDYLLDLATPRPVSKLPKRKREKVPTVTRQLLDVIGLPAFVEGRYFDVLAANELAYALSPTLRVGQNRLRSVFLDPAEQALYRNGTALPPVWSPVSADRSATTSTSQASPSSSANCHWPARGSGSSGRAKMSTSAKDHPNDYATPPSVTSP